MFEFCYINFFLCLFNETEIKCINYTISHVIKQFIKQKKIKNKNNYIYFDLLILEVYITKKGLSKLW